MDKKLVKNRQLQPTATATTNGFMGEDTTEPTSANMNPRPTSAATTSTATATTPTATAATNGLMGEDTTEPTSANMNPRPTTVATTPTCNCNTATATTTATSGGLMEEDTTEPTTTNGLMGDDTTEPTSANMNPRPTSPTTSQTCDCNTATVTPAIITTSQPCFTLKNETVCQPTMLPTKLLQCKSKKLEQILSDLKT